MKRRMKGDRHKKAPDRKLLQLYLDTEPPAAAAEEQQFEVSTCYDFPLSLLHSIQHSHMDRDCVEK